MALPTAAAIEDHAIPTAGPIPRGTGTISIGQDITPPTATILLTANDLVTFSS